MPTLNFSGRLSYQKCASLHARARDKSKGKSLHGSGNYWITRNEREDSYSLRMYRTNILTYFADGTIYVDGYNSSTTNQVLNDYGPVRVWNDSRLPFRCTHRFGGWQNSLPLGDGVHIDPQGFVHGLVDVKRRVIPAMRGERMKIRSQFRQAVTARMILGEFGDLFAEKHRDGAGWLAKVPTYDADEVFALLLNGADHTDIVEILNMKTITYNFGRRDRIYPTYELATLAARESMLRAHLADKHDSPYYEDMQIPYEPQKVI